MRLGRVDAVDAAYSMKATTYYCSSNNKFAGMYKRRMIDNTWLVVKQIASLPSFCGREVVHHCNNRRLLRTVVAIMEYPTSHPSSSSPNVPVRLNIIVAPPRPHWSEKR